MITCDAMEVHFETTYNRCADHVYNQNHRGNCGTCSVGQVIIATLSKTYM